ncbi:transcriptional regulator, XRE family [Leifsonia rubra CMS 76R]|nr:transcriptional regulator, XRE family [Leifsonia rubra CMS 76R]
MAAQSAALDREMARLGRNIRSWRKISGLTAQIAAERAGVSRDTLRAIETGRSTSSENLLAIMRTVGILGPVVDASDPISSDFGSRNLARTNVERVRTPAVQKRNGQ